MAAWVLLLQFLALSPALAAGPLPPGCGAQKEVKQDGSTGAISISSAVAQLLTNTPSLSTTTCVVIRDTQTYSEQVTIQGFTNNGYRLVVMEDPSFVSSAPVVNPPFASTAAFRIINSSISIVGVSIVSTNAVTYGIVASSPSLVLSSVAVSDPNGLISLAGVSMGGLSLASCLNVNVSTADGLDLVNASYSSVVQSTLTTGGSGYAALYLNASSSDTITGSFISDPNGFGANLSANANYNTIAQTGLVGLINGASTVYPALAVNSSRNLFDGDFFTNGLVLGAGATYNTISRSTMTAAVGGGADVDGSSNTITGSFVYAAAAGGLTIRANASYNTVLQSTITSAGVAGYTALNIAGGGIPTYNLVSGCFISGLSTTHGASIFGSFNTISQSTITNNASGYPAVILGSDSSCAVTNSYIQGANAVEVLGSTGAVIQSSILVATNTTGNALWLTGGSAGLSLTSTTVQGGRQGAGILMDSGNSGSVSLAADTVSGGQWGVYISTMNCGGACSGTNLSISNMNFPGGLTAGATAIYFAGGTFVSTFTGVNFADPNIAVNVNGAPLSYGTGRSRITMSSYLGPRAGPSFEDDPNSVIDWVTGTTPPPSSPVISSVGISSITVSWGSVGAPGYIVDASTTSDFGGALISASGSGSATSLTDQNLAVNATYYLRAGALWGGGTSYADTTPPFAVTLATGVSPLSFPLIGLSSFTLAWQANGNPPGTTYEASISTSITFGSLVGSVVTTTTTAAPFLSLVQNATYYVRVRPVNFAGVPSPYSLGVVITTPGTVITISANRLTGVWYNAMATIFNAQGPGVSSFHWRITSNPTDNAVGTDPSFDGSATQFTMPEGINYFHVRGLDSGGGTVGYAHFGPVEVDVQGPAIPSVSAQASAADTTLIADGGTTRTATPRIKWLAASSTSPMVGYSLSVSTNAGDQPSQSITTNGLFWDWTTGAGGPLGASGVYYVKLIGLNLAGNWGPAPAAQMSFTYTTIPSASGLTLKNNYFNPLRGGCMELDVLSASAGRLKIDLYTLMGQRVVNLQDADIAPGTYSFPWCGKNSAGEYVASGGYILHVEAPDQKENLKVAVVK